MTDQAPARISVPEPLWMMHVIGPDDLYPAPCHATAVQWCAYLNREIAPKVPEVLCVAVPAIWTGSPEEHAEGLPEAVKGWTLPAAAPAVEGGEVWREQIARFCEDRAGQYENSEDVRQQGHARGLREAAIVARTLPLTAPASSDAGESVDRALLEVAASTIRWAIDRGDDLRDYKEPLALVLEAALTTPASGEIGAAMKRVEAVSLGSDVSDVYGAESFAHPNHTFRGDLRAILSVLTTPAKVDAVGCKASMGTRGDCSTISGCDCAAPTTSAAASDKLRIAVEALEEIAKNSASKGWTRDLASQALSALTTSEGK